MGVKCPKHHMDLEIEYTSIDMYGSKNPVVTGQCPVCKIKYLSREIMSSNGSFKIGGQVYEYLNDMEKAYPYTVKVREESSLPKTNEKNYVKKEIESHKEPQKPSNQQKKNMETIKQKAAAEAKKAEENKKRQLDAREAGILQIRQRNSQGLNKSYRARKLFYSPTIPKKCPNDGEQLDYVKRTILDFSGSQVQRSSWCCFRCRTAFFLESEREEISQQITRAQTAALKKSVAVVVQQKSATTVSSPTNFSIPENTLYVCKGLIACNRKGHAIESATGVMLGKNGVVIKINANFCPQCRKYFIGHDEYVRYRQIYGVLLGNIKLTNGSFVPFEGNLAEESILHMCGYSVNQTANLSSVERHNILQYLIDSKVSSKPEIIDYLNFFIKRNGKRQNMEEAVCRWNDDLKWVREYQLNRQRHFEIANIQKNK